MPKTPDEIDLSLVSIDSLMEELELRCVCFICAYQLPKEVDKVTMYHFGKGSWNESCRLSSILNNDVLNNWSGELITLQRLNEEM